MQNKRLGATYVVSLFNTLERTSIMVKTKNLLLIASFIWIIAGTNILKIGISTYIGHITPINIILSIIIFAVFWLMIFKNLVNKHTLRITRYEEPKKYFWNFFDKKSFIIMAIMMIGGISIRTFHILPNTFIAIFYSGIGLALTVAGIWFGIKYVTHIKSQP